VIAVVGFHTRAEMAENLAAEVGGKLFMDDGSLGEWGNHARAWSWVASQSDYGVVLQDDVVPVSGFAEKALAASELRPESAIGFYMGTGTPQVVQPSLRMALQRAEAEKVSWIKSSRILWGPAIGMPTRHVKKMLDEYTGRYLYDTYLGGWLARNRVPAFYTYPSLVDHRDTPTTLDKAPEHARVAHTVGPQTDPHDLRCVSFWT
jgi:hypothetical protein